MAKKIDNQEESDPFDYFAREKAAQKPAVVSTENIVIKLRSEMLPSTETVPAQENLLQRVNLKIAAGIFIGLILLAVVVFVISGSGRPLLEKKLEGLIETQAVTSPPSVPTSIPSTTVPAIATQVPTSSPTIRPTRIQSLIAVSSPTLLSSSPSPEVTATTVKTSTPRSSSDCRDVLSITTGDVGQTLCVQGVVKELISSPSNFMVVFSNEKGAFYWVSYDLVWSKGEVDHCYKITGKIDQIASSPILIFNYGNMPEECP